jgi:hypothetical protein
LEKIYFISYTSNIDIVYGYGFIRQNGKIGLDEDWEKSGIIPFESEISTTGIEYCEDRCLKNQLCIALHYTHNHCFIYGTRQCRNDRMSHPTYCKLRSSDSEATF